jgi:LysM repeat protein
MTKSCNKFYFVVQGDGCTSIQTKFSITFAQLFSWNPAIGSNCESLWLNTNICVGVIGGATTTTKTSATTTTTSGNGITTPTPTQDGMTKNCNKFYLVVSGDGCTSIQTKYSITFAQLFSWNPAIGSNCESLWLNTYVCVGVIGQTTTPTTSKTTTSTTTKTGNGITTPTPTQDGMNPNCDKFYMVVSGDGCQKIADQFSIDLSQFYSWNPAVGNTCSSLWLNTYVCVHVIGATTKPTSTTKTTSTTTQGNGVSTLHVPDVLVSKG